MKRSKLGIILGAATASLALTGCNMISNNEYAQKVNDLSSQIMKDMIDSGLNVYKYEQTLFGAGDYEVLNGNDCRFLSFPNDIIVTNVSEGEHKSLVVYSISEKDYNTVANLEKSKHHDQNAGVFYTGDIEVLSEIIGKDTSKLYSVSDLTANTVLYSVENQNTMTDNGMEM